MLIETKHSHFARKSNKIMSIKFLVSRTSHHFLIMRVFLLIHLCKKMAGRKYQGIDIQHDINENIPLNTQLTIDSSEPGYASSMERGS